MEFWAKVNSSIGHFSVEFIDQISLVMVFQNISEPILQSVKDLMNSIFLVRTQL